MSENLVRSLERQARVLRVLSRCGRALARATDLDEFMHEVCRVAVESGYLLAWIGRCEGVTVVPAARAGRDERDLTYVDGVKVTTVEGPRGMGPVGVCVRTRKPASTRFVATDEAFAPWREQALARGYASVLAVPLLRDDVVWGVILVYAGEPDAFDEQEVGLLVDLGALLSFAAGVVEERQARRDAEARVLHLNAVLRGIRDVNQVITRERDPRPLIQKACDALVCSRGFDFATITLTDGDRITSLAYATPTGKPPAVWPVLESGVAPRCFRAAVDALGCIVVPGGDPMCDGCPGGGVGPRRGDWVTTCLRDDSGPVGVLCVLLPKGAAAALEELSLLEEVARDVARALKAIESERLRVAAVEELRLSSERWRATFDAIKDALCVVSPTYELLEANEALCAMLGLPRERVCGRKCYELMHGTYEPIPGCPCERAAETGEFVAAELEQAGKSYDLTAWPMNLGGSVCGFVHVISDVTQDRRREREREELQEQLRMSQKLEAVGKLAGGIAHDFNNLLSVIINHAEFSLESPAMDESLRQDIEEIRHSGERAATLTRQLLAFSRKQLLRPEVVDLNGIVTGMQGMLTRLIGEDIELRTNLAHGLSRIKADPGQLEQVVMNLAVNARDAMERGGRLTIETQDVELDEAYAELHVSVAPGPHVMMAVTDTGTGMDELTQAHVFEPFFTTKARGKGTGLGLSTVYGIVKQSGGNIWVYSEQGKGTTFKVYFPVVNERGELRSSAPPAESTTGTETVLVVEDEETVRKLARRILMSAGYRVLVAESGADALALAEQHDGVIDLVLTDVIMPQMSGRELVERLAAVRPGVKALYMSGYTDDAIVHHGVLEAGTNFIGKPFNAAALARKVREVLDSDDGGA